VNRPIPKLGSVKGPGELSEKFFKNYSHIAFPITTKVLDEKSEIEIDLPKKEVKALEEIFKINFAHEIIKHGAGISGKPGELIDIPTTLSRDQMLKLEKREPLLVGKSVQVNHHCSPTCRKIAMKLKFTYLPQD